MNNNTKLKYYDILNSVKMEYLKERTPFNILKDSDIKITYKDIKLEFVDGKNYFVKVDKSKGNFDRTPWTKEQKKEFYKNKAKEDRNQKSLPGSWSDKNIEWTKKQRESYAKGDSGQNRNRGRDRSQSPRREFTAEETAAYEERKKQREKRGGRVNPILIYY